MTNLIQANLFLLDAIEMVTKFSNQRYWYQAFRFVLTFTLTFTESTDHACAAHFLYPLPPSETTPRLSRYNQLNMAGLETGTTAG